MSLTVFGLTGGIASGKSAVAKHWRELGLPVVDADALAREAVAPGSACLSQIAQTFGEHMLRDGELDRARMAADVFSNPERLKQLNQIVHPEVQRLAAQRFHQLEQEGHELACYEVPLLYEGGLQRIYSPVVVVNAPEQLRIKRLTQRDGMTLAQAEQRISSQLPLSEKVARATYVIDNSGAIEDTLHQADDVLTEIRRSIRVAPPRST